MSMLHCSSLAVLLAFPLSAQRDAPARAERPEQDRVAAPVNAFYRAFYLSRGERRYDQALTLYRRFLAAAPGHRYAGRAATEALSLLHRLGKHEEADKFRAKYAALLERAPTGRPAGRGDRPRRGDGRAAGGNAELRERLAELRKRLEQARKDGDEETVARLRRQIARAERSLRGEGRGGQRGGKGRAGRRGRGGFRMNLVEMNDEQIERFLERMGGFTERMLERLEEAGRGDDAKKLGEQWAKVKKLLADGKKEEAQKVLADLRGKLFRRRR